jgi:hypothetical protein
MIQPFLDALRPRVSIHAECLSREAGGVGGAAKQYHSGDVVGFESIEDQGRVFGSSEKWRFYRETGKTRPTLIHPVAIFVEWARFRESKSAVRSRLR